MINAGIQEAERAQAVCTAVGNCGWVAGGLTTGGSMAPLTETTRPIEQLNAAGLSALAPYVQPLQDVPDRLAGNASVIQSFADTWQKVAQSVDQVGRRLGDALPTDTAAWQGEAADRYRGRAAEVTAALHGTATLSTALSTLAARMGEVVAGARQNADELLSDLVQRLISYVNQASAAEGGLTANVMAQATSMIDTYRQPITGIEDKLRQTIGNVDTLFEPGATTPSATRGGQPVQLAMAGMSPGLGHTGSQSDSPVVLAAGGGRRKAFEALLELFTGKGKGKPIEVPPTKPQQQPQQPQKQWPKREDYDNNRDFGRDKGNALKDLQRPFEGSQLKNGWEVSKVERTAGGTKRVDVMYVNHKEKRILVEDYYAGKLEPVEHANKGWRYQHEKEIQDLIQKGYKYDYVVSYTEKLQ